MNPTTKELVRYAWLAAEINRHDIAYYTLARPTISDFDYDQLYRELRDFEEHHPAHRLPDSPTARVGAPPLAEFRQVAHRQRMESLDNTYNPAEVGAFLARVQKTLGDQPVSYLIEPKVDGVAVSIRYEHGALALGLTRGDGTQGDDITENLKTIRQLPLTLAGAPEVLEVRGEVYMTHRAFAKLNREREEQGAESFANARNATAGTLKLLDSRAVARRPLAIVLYGVGEVSPGHGFDSQTATLARLAALGFPVPEWHPQAAGPAAVLAAINALDHQRQHFTYPTDGAVVKVDDFAARATLGSTAKAPRWAVAYKFAPVRAATCLHAITFQIGRTGVITPVAELEPVYLSGTTVRRATLHNADEITRKDIREGDTVIIEKAGEIIPQVIGVIQEYRPPTTEPFDFAARLAELGLDAARAPGEAVWRLRQPTREQQIRALTHFAAKPCLDIASLGPAMAETLVTAGLVTTPGDLFTLKHEQLILLENLADKSADHLLAGIAAARHRELWRLLHALGIPNVGAQTARDLAKHFGTLDTLANATYENYLQKKIGKQGQTLKAEESVIPGIGATVAQSLLTWFNTPAHRALLEQLRAAGVNFTVPPPAGGGTGTGQRPPPLAGKTFVITGILTQPRLHFEARIHALGGEVRATVGQKTTYLLAGVDPGSKLKKAVQLGIPILDEAAFERLTGAA
ncbi:MAG: NAD-dependent DNA ligase LigA [Verrucomicrobiales bacterium]|nr:NAD-dependent DNA ligase LigA [Verrucomicrobiales bacterium]